MQQLQLDDGQKREDGLKSPWRPWIFRFWSTLFCATNMCEINAQELVFTCKVCSKVEAGTWGSMLCGWRFWSICQHEGWVKPAVFQHEFMMFMQGLNIYPHLPAIQLSWWLRTKRFILWFSGCSGAVRLCPWMPKRMSLAIRRKSKIFASSDTMFSLWRRKTWGEDFEKNRGVVVDVLLGHDDGMDDGEDGRWCLDAALLHFSRLNCLNVFCSFLCAWSTVNSCGWPC